MENIPSTSTVKGVHLSPNKLVLQSIRFSALGHSMRNGTFLHPPLGIGPYSPILFFIEVYMGIQHKSAISHARLEKSYIQVTILGSPRNSVTMDQGRFWTNDGSWRCMSVRLGVIGYSEYDGDM